MVERPLSRRAAAAAVLALLVAGCATGRADAPPAGAEGYLPGAEIQRLGAALAAAPSAPAADAAGLWAAVPPATDRWWLATAHAELRPPWAAQHFDCALGTRLAERPRPALTRLMRRLAADAAALTRTAAAGATGSSPRPFVARPELEPCERVPAAVRASPSRSAAGAVVSGAWGEMFAALAPDAAGPVRRTAREVGWSRAVCRMNWPADVEAGLATGVALYRAAETQPGFAGELAAARAEVTEARAEGLSSPACAAERRALRQWRAPPAPEDQAGRGPTSEP